MNQQIESNNSKDWIKSFYDSQERLQTNGHCLDVQELFDWTSGKIDSARREDLIHHASRCSLCTEKIAHMKRLQSEAFYEKNPEPKSEKKMKALLRSRSRTIFLQSFKKVKKFLWPMLFLIFMILSFLLNHYFIQMLVLALVSAGKWIADSRTRRIQIDVSHKDEGTGEQTKHPRFSWMKRSHRR